MPNPYLYNREQRDLQQLQSVLGLMDYFEKRKQLKHREETLRSLPEGVQNLIALEQPLPKEILMKLSGVVVPEEPETPEQKRIRFGEMGRVPIEEEFPIETGFKPVETEQGLGFTPIRPFDVKSTIAGVNRLKGQGLQFTGKTPLLAKPKEGTATSPTALQTELAMLNNPKTPETTKKAIANKYGLTPDAKGKVTPTAMIEAGRKIMANIPQKQTFDSKTGSFTTMPAPVTQADSLRAAQADSLITAGIDAMLHGGGVGPLSPEEEEEMRRLEAELGISE